MFINIYSHNSGQVLLDNIERSIHNHSGWGALLFVGACLQAMRTAR